MTIWIASHDPKAMTDHDLRLAQVEAEARRTRVDLEREVASLKLLLSKSQNELEAKSSHYRHVIVEKDRLYESLVTGSVSKNFGMVSSLLADHVALQYQISARVLESKKHPARVEAKRIEALKQVASEMAKHNRLLQYKFELLLQVFPDLESYIDEPDAVQELARVESPEEIDQFVDKTRQYLSKEEYANLPEDERNQLALDRYIQGAKSNWQIGRDYEMFIGYGYATDGWKVEYHGIERSLSDMGRDLITWKGDEIHVVQCKYWAQHKQIHEKHIAQLYGTAVQYFLTTDRAKKVSPVLVTNIQLSENAKMFADYLGVGVAESRPMGIFPRIKCNINRGADGKESKIYHLPMDQQYDRTKIERPGEFFAFTVKEAVRAGFRRAWKWHVE